MKNPLVLCCLRNWYLKSIVGLEYMSKSVISACFQVLFVLPADRIDGVSSAYRAVVTDCVGHVGSREAD